MDFHYLEMFPDGGKMTDTAIYLIEADRFYQVPRGAEAILSRREELLGVLAENKATRMDYIYLLHYFNRMAALCLVDRILFPDFIDYMEVKTLVEQRVRAFDHKESIKEVQDMLQEKIRSLKQQSQRG